MIPGTTEPLLASHTPVSAAREGSGLRWFFWGSLGLLVLCFGKPLYELVRFGVQFDLYSHILLVPFICAYLVWINRHALPPPSKDGSRAAGVLALAAFLILSAYWALSLAGRILSPADQLVLTILPFHLLVIAAVLFWNGLTFARAVAFPLAFLIFMVPLPEKITEALEIASQHASAEVYSWMMSFSQAVYFRDGLIFSLPGKTIRVAQECSGIRSSLVLFITSLLAGHMFLRSRWKQALLAFAVFPLGIVRNAFRIYTLSLLSTHWSPKVFDSPLHHQGGPLFFALSLVPFFLLLFWLRRSESSPRHSP